MIPANYAYAVSLFPSLLLFLWGTLRAAVLLNRPAIELPQSMSYRFKIIGCIGILLSTLVQLVNQSFKIKCPKSLTETAVHFDPFPLVTIWINAIMMIV